MIRFHENGKTIAEIIEDNQVISDVQDMLDLMGDCGVHNCSRIIIREAGLHPDFFRLHTGLAGEILQKFSTYDFRLAIIGEFAKFTSKNLQDFIRESNKGNRIFFVNDYEEALKRLRSV
jgi:hypothetical protein